MKNAFKCTNIELLVSCKTDTYYLLEDKWYYHNYYYLSYFWVANVYISIVLKTKTQYLQQLANHNITIKRKLYLYNYFFCRLPIPTNILVYSLSGYPIHLHGVQYHNSFNKINIGTLNLFILCIIYSYICIYTRYSVMNLIEYFSIIHHLKRHSYHIWISITFPSKLFFTYINIRKKYTHPIAKAFLH